MQDPAGQAPGPSDLRLGADRLGSHRADAVQRALRGAARHRLPWQGSQWGVLPSLCSAR